MSDGVKTRLAMFSFASMAVLPIVFLLIGLVGWDFRTGALLALITFAVLFTLAGVLLATVRDLSPQVAAMPFVASVIYSVLPDFFVGPIDDSVAVSAGALLTFGLWIKKQPDAPKWLVLPLLASGVYTLVGGAIPGPVDELLVAVVGTGVSGLAASRSIPGKRKLEPEADSDPIEGQYTVQEPS